MNCVEFTDVAFGYGRRRPVLDAFSHTFEPGATVLLGPNGAGKSTLLALAASSLTPLRGTVTVGDLKSTRRSDRARYRATVGWLPQRSQVVPGFSLREQVAYAGWLKGMNRSDAWAKALPALDMVDLADLATRSATQLSGGQRQRLGVAEALVHEASVLLLDEPTAGLDPAQRRSVRELVVDLSNRVTLIVSTHETQDLDSIYGSVVVLAAGQVRWSGSCDDFLKAAPDNSRDPAESAYELHINARPDSRAGS